MKKKIITSLVMLVAVTGVSSDSTLHASELNITAKPEATTSEEVVLSDLRLKDIFDVEVDPGSTVTIDKSHIDYNTPGTYPVTFTENLNGETDSVTSNLIITDLKPHISLESTHEQAEAGQEIDLVSEFGLVATEAATGDMTANVVVDDSQVNYNHVGTYPVYFSVTDEEGNVATAQGDLNLRSDAPIVKAETIENSFELSGDFSTSNIISAYGVTATDSDGIDYIEADLSTADVSTVGRYNVIFRAYDIYGQVSDDLYAIIEVVEDAPKLTITADDHARTSEEVPLTDLRLRDIFNVEFDAGALIAVDQSQIDYNTPGTYPVTFTETLDGQTASVTSNLEIYDRLPQITTRTVHAQYEVGHEVDLIEAFGVVGTEAVTGDSTDQIIIDDSEVDYNHVGHYNVYYTLTDEEGNTTSFTGDLYLRSDAPDVTADTNIKVPEGSSYTNQELLDLFNVVADDKDGIDHIDVNTTQVDFNTPGRYTITFTAYDAFGQASEEFYSIIEVTDVLPTINSEDEITIVIGSDQTVNDQLNIDATEITDGDLTSQVVVDDSQVNYEVEGDYQATLTVTDDEGNTISKTVTVHIIADETDNGNSCLNNAGHTNNSHNCDGTTTCNNNGNNCDKPNNGNNGNANDNGNASDKPNNGNGKN